VNADNEHLAFASYPSHVRVVRCGFSVGATDVRGEISRGDGRVAIRLSPGGPVLRTSLGFGWFRHNLLLAAAVARHLGMSEDAIAAAASSLAPAPLRGEVRSAGAATLLVDCYNSNPLSAAAALDEMHGRSGQKSAVLGDMLELGPDAPGHHEELGRKAARAGVTDVVFVGAHGSDFMRGFGDAGRVHAHRSPGEAKMSFERLCERGGTILVKASRGVGLERLLAREEAAHE
jgi:UDP-N-acetylmuramyl pentapeptide synthase